MAADQSRRRRQIAVNVEELGISPEDPGLHSLPPRSGSSATDKVIYWQLLPQHCLYRSCPHAKIEPSGQLPFLAGGTIGSDAYTNMTVSKTVAGIGSSTFRQQNFPYPTAISMVFDASRSTQNLYIGCRENLNHCNNYIK